MNIEKRGDLTIANSGPGNQFRRVALFSSVEGQSEEQLLGMQEAEPVFSPGDYFHAPNNFLEPLDIETESPRLILQYRDNLVKNTPISSAYEVTVLVAYVEKHPDIEKIADPRERKRLYDRAISNTLPGSAS